MSTVSDEPRSTRSSNTPPPLSDVVVGSMKEEGEIASPEPESTQGSDDDSEGDSPDPTAQALDEASNSTPEPTSSQPPLPEEPLPPPLPDEPLPAVQTSEDDGWAPVWDANAQAYYFFNRFTNATQWENPRVSTAPTPLTHTNHERIAQVAHAPGTQPYLPVTQSHAPGTQPYMAENASSNLHPAVFGGYNPAVHGDYDPNADYAQAPPSPSAAGLQYDPANPTAHLTPDGYAATATFNRFTGRFQAPTLTTENYNDEAKSKRQMNAFFDVDAASNGHDGRSLRAERAGKKLSKSEVKAFKDKRREKKEEKRRAWLRD